MPTRFHHDPSCPIAGVELYRVERDSAAGVTIDIRATPSGWPAPGGSGGKELVEKRWAAMVADNPRLYSGPLLSVVAIDGEIGVIHTMRDEFKRLAVQPQVRTGVQILSVTGAITAKDSRGREHVLLGRRGRGTRVYGGMWELGPAGGIPPPHAIVTTLDEADAARHLLEEAEEELGLILDLAKIRPVTLYIRDTIAHSDDLTFVVGHEEAGSMERLAAQLGESRATHAWEYEETRWVPLDPHDPQGLFAFDRDHASEIIITTRAAFRGLGWV
jgi:hypothetical protein